MAGEIQYLVTDQRSSYANADKILTSFNETIVMIPSELSLVVLLCLLPTATLCHGDQNDWRDVIPEPDEFFDAINLSILIGQVRG